MLLHGAGKTRLDWHNLGYVERLKDDFTVITVDIRGTGESDYLVDIEVYAIEKICRDLFRVADACSVDRFAIWGFSFGGIIARYPAAWNDRISAIAMIGVPFGPAVDDAFEKVITGFEKKYGDLAKEQKKPAEPSEKRTPIKGQMDGWLACFRAMRRWPRIDPGDVRCPTLMVAGTKNKNLMSWLKNHEEELEQAGVELQIINGLAHYQEFSEIDKVFPGIYQFFKNDKGTKK